MENQDLKISMRDHYEYIDFYSIQWGDMTFGSNWDTDDDNPKRHRILGEMFGYTNESIEKFINK